MSASVDFVRRLKADGDARAVWQHLMRHYNPAVRLCGALGGLVETPDPSTSASTGQTGASDNFRTQYLGFARSGSSDLWPSHGRLAVGSFGTSGFGRARDDQEHFFAEPDADLAPPVRNSIATAPLVSPGRGWALSPGSSSREPRGSMLSDFDFA